MLRRNLYTRTCRQTAAELSSMPLERCHLHHLVRRQPGRRPCSCAQINLVQCQNLSWFGYPDDTVPSVRSTLLPGITKV